MPKVLFEFHNFHQLVPKNVKRIINSLKRDISNKGFLTLPLREPKYRVVALMSKPARHEPKPTPYIAKAHPTKPCYVCTYMQN